MPRPCAVEVNARGYKIRRKGFCGCHGLAPWSLTLAAKKEKAVGTFWGCHGLVPWRLTLAATKYVGKGFADATALRRGASRSPLQRKSRGTFWGCHGLATWSLTLAATKSVGKGFVDATALCRGASRSLLTKTSFHVPSIGRDIIKASPICRYSKMKLECTRYLTNVPTIVSTSRAPLRILLSCLSAISHSPIPTAFTISFTQTLRTRQSDAALQHTCP